MADLPDWLDDVAKAEKRGPAQPVVSSQELPPWLEDLKLWCELDTASAIAKPAPLSPEPAAPPLAFPAAAVADDTLTAREAGVPMAIVHEQSEPAPALQTQVPVAIVHEQTEAAPAVLDAEIVEDTGFDVISGQILDAAKFQKWSQQKTRVATAAASNASLMEVFREARLAIERWVDDDGRRAVVMRGNIEEIVLLPDLAAVLEQFADYGPVLRNKLLKHLAFMVENRRQYYAVCPE